MVFVPFIFFTILTVYWIYKRKEFGISQLLSSLYAICSLMAAILVLTDNVEGGGILWLGWKVEVNVISTLSYCLLIGLTLLPFSFIKLSNIKTITNTAPISLIILSALIVVVSFICIYIVADSTLDILSGDLKDVRNAFYEGEETPAEIKAKSMNYVFRILLYLNVATILALPLAFYYLCFYPKYWWWSLLLFFSSLSMPILGIQTVDRTEIVYWGLMFLYCIIFFHRFFTKGIKIALSVASSILSIVALVYLMAVSMARFEDSDNGTFISMTQYGGQGFLNYCYFCENADFNLISSEREFPIFNHYVKKIDSTGDRRNERSAKQGFFISVFPSFAGDILLDLGPIGVVLWVIGYAILTIIIIREYYRNEFNVGEVLLLFVLVSVPLFGIFYYRFHTVNHGYVILVAIVFYFISKIKFVFSRKDDDICNYSNIQ